MLNTFYSDKPFVKKEQAESKDLDSIQLFMDDISQFDLLSADEEKSLGKRIAKGDLKARNELVDANYRLVVKYAKKYTFSGLDLEDLIQAGCMGLMKAADKFDYKLGYRFSTYASQWILQSIRRAIADTGRTIRVPVHMQEAVSKQKKAVENLTQRLGRKPTIEEIADETGYTVDKVWDIFAVIPDAVSLDNPIGEDEDDDMYEVVSDIASEMPDEQAIRSALHNDLEKALDTLSGREATILRLRSGLEDGVNYSLESIAKELGITRERVRQIESEALRKLRYSPAGNALKEYLAA